MKTGIGSILSLLALGAMAASPDAAKDEAVYRGMYFYNFENSVLTPDGTQENWCIDAASMSEAMLPAKDSSGPWGTAHVVVQGKLGPEGRYGGLGRCNRVLIVTRIIDITDRRGRK